MDHVAPDGQEAGDHHDVVDDEGVELVTSQNGLAAKFLEAHQAADDAEIDEEDEYIHLPR